MIERSQNFRLPLKAAHSLTILDELLRQDLERNLSTQTGIGGLVDHAHPALANLLKDPIVRDGLADQRSLQDTGEPI